MDRHQVLYELAPLGLHNFRVRRYHGDDQCLALSTFAEVDRERLRTLYGFLLELQAALYFQGDTPVVPRVMELLRLHPVEGIVDLIRPLGRASVSESPAPSMAKTLHDLRGGGLTALIGELDLAERRPLAEGALDALRFLTRDHLKIMRNALLGLDDVKRNEDLQPKIHGTDFIVEKWHGASLRGLGREIRLEVDCPLSVPISECCVEFGALDRILYNLINNACRHAASDCIHLVLLPVPDNEGKDLRFILSNVVSPQDFHHLSAMNLETLFEEGASTTGSGFGLAIASDFVTHAYGLGSHRQAIEGGYLGAALIEKSFAAWFHWPRILQD